VNSWLLVGFLFVCNVVQALPFSHRVGLVKDENLTLWHSEMVPKADIDALKTTPPKSPGVFVADSVKAKKILDSFGISENANVIEFSSGTQTQAKIEKLTLALDSGECAYGFKNYFEGTLNPSPSSKQGEDSGVFVGMVLPKSMRVVSVTPEQTKEVEDLVADDPNVKSWRAQVKKLDQNTKFDKAKVLGIADASQKYFITEDPAPNMGMSYNVFILQAGKMKKVDSLEFPPCGS
jgi:hypothetical protein